MGWGCAAMWDTRKGKMRVGNCMLPLGKCNRQLAAPSCQERKLLMGAGPAGIQPSSSWRAPGCPHHPGRAGSTPWARQSLLLCVPQLQRPLSMETEALVND